MKNMKKKYAEEENRQRQINKWIYDGAQMNTIALAKEILTNAPHAGNK